MGYKVGRDTKKGIVGRAAGATGDCVETKDDTKGKEGNKKERKGEKTQKQSRPRGTPAMVRKTGESQGKMSHGNLKGRKIEAGSATEEGWFKENPSKAGGTKKKYLNQGPLGLLKPQRLQAERHTKGGFGGDEARRGRMTLGKPKVGERGFFSEKKKKLEREKKN